MLGHLIRFNNKFSMSVPIFLVLLYELHSNHELHDSSRTTTREELTITLYIQAQNKSIRGALECFQHSSEAISWYFSMGLKALVSLAAQIIRSEDPSFETTPVKILNDPRYKSFFKNYIGPIDGTRVDARLPNHGMGTYICWCGSLT
ncbi:uncharacterized protein LOC110038699 [Phalaenopsis equestris]|uniref:uncharacterized protein LOC110038699 n=1 Tax=Phalaenopsis equestris TaxID=78828 RepID=UPI0009E21AB7|nr:uncharacterized protein LOC110038699 [Phalaenopsis equestris]